MKMEQVSDSCYAVLNEKNRVCDANSGLINLGGGVVIDTQSDLGHARQMIELFSKVWSAMPNRVINTHEDADHVWGNQLFADAEIIGAIDRVWRAGWSDGAARFSSSYVLIIPILRVLTEV